MNSKSRRAMVHAMKTISETETALGDKLLELQNDVHEVREIARATEKKASSLSGEMRAVRESVNSGLSRIEALLAQQKKT